MTLLEKQHLFARLYATLILKMYEQGYEVSLDWVYRPAEVAAYYASIGLGIRSSLHTLKLAGDINLFKDGEWLRATEAHNFFGNWWEQQSPLCRWGGRWGDGNHYSLAHDGRK